jgi:hypothetical protein
MHIPVPQKYGVGQTQPPQLPTLQGLATVAHAPPTVSLSDSSFIHYHFIITIINFFSTFFSFRVDIIIIIIIIYLTLPSISFSNRRK